MTVEAKDNEGVGKSATSRVRILVKDINDSPPVFKEQFYKGVMTPDFRRLRDPVIVEAVDDDAEDPNNRVEYSMRPTTYSEYFTINRETGRIDVRNGLKLPQVNLKRIYKLIQ